MPSSRKRTRVVTGVLRVNTYAVFSRAVAEGAACGCQRAHKYTDKPTRDAVVDAVTEAVLAAVCEVFKFDDEEG